MVLVRERTGIRILDHQIRTLLQTVADACRRFEYRSCDQYIEVLEGSRPDSPLQEHLIAGITVGESYFLRDQAQMAFLRQQWLPRILAERRAEGRLELRIWSAGCADGQEILSIAMFLAELLPDIDKWNLHLLATDINVDALSRALAGSYKEWSMRALDEPLRQRFFDHNDGRYRVDPRLHRLIHYAYLNLHSDQYPSILSQTNALDLVLCRNVFIYFDPQIVNRVMAKFHACLNPGGCLLLGASDLVDSCAIEGFRQHSLGDTFYLERPDVALQPVPATAAVEVQSTVPLWVPSPPPVPEPAPPPRGDLAPAVQPYQEIVSLFGDSAWGSALAVIEARLRNGDDTALVWQFRAKALANLGRTRDALEACDRSIDRDPTDKHSHFIRALVLIEQKRLSAAADALRRTLFLDRRFLEAHYQLGLLLMRQGDREGGVKALKNALRIAEAAHPSQPLHDAAGMNHGRMAAILRNELRIVEQQAALRAGVVTS